MKRKTSIIIVDDHPIVRKGIKILLAQEIDFHLRRELETIKETWEFLQTCQSLPNVAIIDLSLNDGSGLELIRMINHHYPAIAVLVLSMHEEIAFATLAFQAGARGYVMKKSSLKNIISAISTVASGGMWFSHKVAQKYLADSMRVRKDKFQCLSFREKHVLQLIGMGYKNNAIASALGIKIKTVNTYKENLKAKLGFESVNLLTAFACQQKSSTILS